MKKFSQGIIIFIKLLRESFAFAATSVKADKTRTFLSLLGVTIGIFSIVAVFTTIDSLKGNISRSLASLGSDVVYIMQFSWQLEEGETEYKPWEYRQRPPNTYEDFLSLQQHATTAEAIAFSVDFTKEVKYGRNIIPSTSISGVTTDWPVVSMVKIGTGRYFSQLEAGGAYNVAILGYGIAAELFQEEDPLGKIIKIDGSNTRIIGVMEEEGSGEMLSINESDQLILIPYHYACTMVDPRQMFPGPTIVVKKKEAADKDEFLGELRTILRNTRRLKPSQKNNFSINEVSVLQDVTNQIFGTISAVGWIIGGFSILIGGFGVANIMFVSVKERTNIIGIQKALGAKNYFILTQFLFEAALLAILGGLVGLLIVFFGAEIVSRVYDFQMTLTLGNILRGVIVSTAIGLVAGILPAYMAAHLNPVVAINAK
ncbi:MAG: ABC transporter permease [Bacteroidetes bacterium]|nr:ABC transporter permease [Bacteroidota bacterium]